MMQKQLMGAINLNSGQISLYYICYEKDLGTCSMCTLLMPGFLLSLKGQKPLAEVISYVCMCSCGHMCGCE